MAIGVWGGIAGLGGALAPTLGALLVDWAGWRAVFFINLPFVVAALVAGVAIVLPRSERRPGALRPGRRADGRDRRRRARARHRPGRRRGAGTTRGPSPASSSPRSCCRRSWCARPTTRHPLLDLDLFRAPQLHGRQHRPGAVRRLGVRLAGADAVVLRRRVGLVAAGRRVRAGAGGGRSAPSCRRSPAASPTASATAGSSPPAASAAPPARCGGSLPSARTPTTRPAILPGMVLGGLGITAGFATLTGRADEPDPAALLLDGRRGPEHDLPAGDGRRDRRRRRPAGRRVGRRRRRRPVPRRVDPGDRLPRSAASSCSSRSRGAAPD